MSNIRKVSRMKLPNPFLRRTRPSVYADNRSLATPEEAQGYVSGRSTEITEIIMGDQGAIILAGAPHIGKTALIHYLDDNSDICSWREELIDLKDLVDLDAIHFTSIDLTPLGRESPQNQYSAFQKQCIRALQAVYRPVDGSTFSTDLPGLRHLLAQAGYDHPNGRYFVMLDSIERLGHLYAHEITTDGKIETAQDRGLALLQQCGAIRMLIDLRDEFPYFGIILSIELQPRPDIGQQFSRISKHLSYDLARFTTMTLKAFSLDDARRFLQQKPESFGKNWATQFRTLTDTAIFTEQEENWLLEQAGTHPYILQQFCFHAFSYKQRHASVAGRWIPLEETFKRQIVDTVKERLSTFFTNIWDRVQQALDQCSDETKQQFYQMFLTSEAKPVQPVATWNSQDKDLRYILACEGLICFDRLQQNVYYPGRLLLEYLNEEIRKSGRAVVPATAGPATAFTTRTVWLTTSCPGSRSEHLSLSELEYRLLQQLLQSPQNCTEKMLMTAAWGKPIDRSTFMQRMHHLRKKLKKHCGEVEMIENRYGGQYSLTHPEWFHLQ
ncbi:MAG: winged helix-turn-helix domain-containing protein [Ktedonobacteraceae bacterium]|nr:winged helix-turn-helix domain-containing protein [Ktedonobacteraceae bacterium]